MKTQTRLPFPAMNEGARLAGDGFLEGVILSGGESAVAGSPESKDRYTRDTLPFAAREPQIPRPPRRARDDKQIGAATARLKARPFLLACCLMLLGALAPAQQVVPWNKVQAPPLPAFTPQEPTRIQLANGMIIFLQPDHELPLITAVARIRGGSINEPANKTGLGDLYGEVWRTGGTKTKTGDQMDDFLEERAAKIEADNQSDSTSISLNCLKGDFDAVFDLYLDLLHNPEFRDDKLALAKQQMYTGISRRNDDVESIVHREALIIGYGKDNPYARVPEYATVAAVTRQDLLDWHQQYVRPNNIIFGISGDFDPRAMEAKLRQAFDRGRKGRRRKCRRSSSRRRSPAITW